MERRDALKTLVKSLGLAISSQTLLTTLTACQQTDSQSKQRFFTHKQWQLLTQLSDVILPNTQTPGAIALQLPSFVDEMVSHTLLAEHQVNFLTGLDLLHNELLSNNRHYQSKDIQALLSRYFDIPPAKQQQMRQLTQLPSKDIVTADKNNYYRYYCLLTLRQLLLLGYYTNEELIRITQPQRRFPIPYQPAE
ncbi:gluconate 2-dehydrogenase subunit 3 family protein [Thalassotalea sp. G2M2-11]|uniref:gluconate 2-dehydrogenase subunit 3 family protein n=1 Tax=Thalassotalea sp. G2M2-11 TaxID=2787627 RepID=UPI0019D17CCD|nr:gluconate 2-dehydrogenase subunit 3 family protein [Thalassotalea sp. G2M2-11]